MSIEYEIKTSLNCKFNKNNIKKLFETAVLNNFLIFKELNKDPINIEITLKNYEEGLTIWSEKYKTGFFIGFYKINENITEINISPFLSILKKTSHNGEYGIDFATYLKILLELCQDFKILEIETNIE